MTKMQAKISKTRIKAVLFDLDGTLLPLDQDTLTKTYSTEMINSITACGYDRDKAIDIIRSGMHDMVNNDGSMTNEERFWLGFSERHGVNKERFYACLDDFHRNGFSRVRSACGYTPRAAETVRLVKSLGLVTVLATSPVFPSIATEARMAWAGLSPLDFAFFTTYENSSYCKPNPDYYVDLANKLGLLPEECLMVGNDVLDDMVASSVGMHVFLLTDCLLNRQGADISEYKQGSFDELCEYIRQLSFSR